ncbi:TRAP transporter small permease subunit [Algirhabdus cladophorae]|uniref:TRAP transporter small permease subunit n=1 Tax=Algirhabdus cladophorae TaxID=3377108 RepID=UPI003B84A3B8
MSGSPIEAAEASISISDPGEVNRDQHLWGDRLMINIGNITAWLFPLLMVAIVTQVIIRKMGYNQAWLDDAQWWMYGFAMLVGFGYAITTDSHVRVDILHQNFSPERKARIEVFALGWLLLPFLGIMTDFLFHYAVSSVVAREGSDSPNGLHMLYLLKASLPLMFFVAIIAAWSATKRNLGMLKPVTFARMIMATLPFAIFVADRIVFYALYWFTRISNPDLNPRRISREPIFEYEVLIAVILLALVAAISILRNRNSPSSEA